MTITSIASTMGRARTIAGLTQRELASRANTAQSLVARIERGHANPTVDTLERLLDAAGFDLRVELVPKPASDPVVDAYKRDIDRTLLRENLKKTPDERLRTLMAMSAFVDEVRRATVKAKRRK